jgi:hypothetical protein
MMSEGKEKVSPMPGVKFRLVDFEDRGICEVTGQVMNGIRYRSEHGHDGVLHWDCWRSENLVIVEPETALDGVGGEALGTPSPDPVEPVREEGVVGHWVSVLHDMPAEKSSVLVWSSHHNQAMTCYHDSEVAEKRGDSGWILAHVKGPEARRVILGVTHWCGEINAPM